MAEGDTFVNAVVGGVAAIVFTAVPMSPVVGGALAGYLEGGTRRDGLRVGAYSGVIAAIPLALVALGFALFTGVVFVGAGPRAGGGVALFLGFVAAAIVASALYTVGLGAVGGWLGNYLKYDTDLGD